MKRHGIVFFIVLSSALLSCGGNADDVGGVTYRGERSDDPQPVEVVTLKMDKLVQKVSGSGVIRGKEEAWSIAETEGTITDLLVRPGDYVSRNDPLLKIDDTLAYWEMKRAQQQFEAADFEYKGIKNSFESGAVSEIEYNRSYAAWYSSRSAYELALRAWENCTLRAPISGRISRMDTSLTEGNLIQRGTALLKVINTEEFILNISLGQREVGLVRPGSRADVYIELADQTLKGDGRVMDVSAGSDGETGSFPVRVIWKNDWSDTVKAGMTARAEIETENTPDRIIIPEQSILERDGGKWVFLASEEKGSYSAQPREIETGNRLGNRIEVLRGLEEGEGLVISGLSSLYPGAPLTVTAVGE